VLRDFAELRPEKFYNLSNGVTPRRFVALANPGLTELITRKIGESWLKDLNQLRDLKPFADDAQFQEKPESASAVSRSVLLGIVPVLIPAPPSSRSFSTSVTRFPKIVAVFAPQIPGGPPPITTPSKSSVISSRHRGE
jgi:hypothetical protein